jgi:hypothetical protein
MQLMEELCEANPVLARFVTTESEKIANKTERERTMLAALVGMKILGLANKNDPDYVKISEESIQQAQQQIFFVNELYTPGTALYEAQIKIDSMISGLNDNYQTKEECVSVLNILERLLVFFGAYSIEIQKLRTNSS